MPPKEKKPKREPVTLQLAPVPQHLLVKHPKRWVTVHFKLMGFSALDGRIRLSSDTTLRMLESKIVSHHGGSIGRLTMWRDRIEPSCVIRDLSLTLKEQFALDDVTARELPALYGGTRGAPTLQDELLGMGGIAAGEGAGPAGGVADHHVLIYYDYRPHESDCPLLLRSPRYPAGASENLDNTRK